MKIEPINQKSGKYSPSIQLVKSVIKLLTFHQSTKQKNESMYMRETSDLLLL